MIGPDYDQSRYRLVSFTSEWALLLDKRDSTLGAVAQCVDGDWELNDAGYFEVMEKKYTRCALPAGSGDLNYVDTETNKIVTIHVGTTKFESAESYSDNPLFGRF